MRTIYKLRSLNIDSQKAQGLFEFAVTIPILLAMMLGIAEFSRLIYVFVSVNTASREAARFGSAIGLTNGGLPRYYDCDGILAAGTKFSVFTGIEDNDFTIWYDDGPNGANLYGNNGTDGCAPLAALTGDDDITLGSRINIKTSTAYVPLVNIILSDIPSFDIVSTARRTIIKDLDINP